MSSLERFLADVSSWYWWISVVVIGLAVNLASAYLKAPLDQWLSKRSATAARRQDLASQAFKIEVDFMAHSPAYLASTGFMEIRHRLMSVIFAAFAALFVRGATNPTRKLLELAEWAIWAQAALLLIGLASAAFALWAHRTAANEASLMFAARQALRSAKEKTGEATASEA